MGTPREPTFFGQFEIYCRNDAISAINIVSLEDYLISVISSEMSATSSEELLKAHAVISRSWLLAQIQHADPQYMDEKKKFHLNDAKPLVYRLHGEYLGLVKNWEHLDTALKKRRKNPKKETVIRNLQTQTMYDKMKGHKHE